MCPVGSVLSESRKKNVRLAALKNVEQQAWLQFGSVSRSDPNEEQKENTSVVLPWSNYKATLNIGKTLANTKNMQK